MIYRINVRNMSGKPVTGATVSFADGTGKGLLTLNTDVSGTVIIPETGQGVMLDSRNIVMVEANGYYQASQSAYLLQPESIFILTSKPALDKTLVAGMLTALAGVYFLSEGKKKKVGGFADNLPVPVKVAVLGIGAYFLLRKGADNKDLQKQSAIELEALASQGVVTTMSATQVSAYANALVTAFDDCGTDEDYIFNVFSKMQNKADVLALITVYGIRSYKGCFDGDYLSTHDRNLAQALTSELSTRDLATVNQIIAAKGIDFKF